jgi:rare lipoprotein A (peptidoglycan hydrolase)
LRNSFTVRPLSMSRFGVPLVLLIGLMLMYDGYCLAARSSIADDTLSFVQSGIASWYGSEEQGKLTANGEHFDRHELTAASRKLPFNTVVRVTNENNGRSVDVRINDRGPYAKGRVLDLSEAAADRLNMQTSGTAPVKIEVVKPATVEAPTAP